MISQTVKQRTDEFWEHIRETNPMILRTRDGKLGAEHIQTYLASVRYLIEHTPIHLRTALNRAELTGRPKLAAYFRAKIQEEQGHDQWATDDLAKLRASHAPANTESVSPEIVKLVRQIERTIEHDPAHYVAYIFLAEYMTVISAPEWLRLLEERCSIPTSVMSVIANHAELDKGHVVDGMREMDELLADSDDARPFLNSLQGCMDALEGFYADIGRMP